jgi:hypothetical protein
MVVKAAGVNARWIGGSGAKTGALGQRRHSDQVVDHSLAGLRCWRETYRSTSKPVDGWERDEERKRAD